MKQLRSLTPAGRARIDPCHRRSTFSTHLPRGLTQEACKCCGAQSVLFGLVDSARSCEPGVFSPSGEPVRYARCIQCGFVFTSWIDHWTEAEIAARIYDAEYVRADPDFLFKRPRFFATMLQAILEPATSTAALDYGGGGGLLARTMRDAGWIRYDSYDPYLDTDAAALQGPYALVTAFEVFEHARDPVGTLTDAFSHLTPDGALLFSTLLLPPDAGPDWWYIAPRNGHVSIHTERSLRALARGYGARFVSLNPGLHLLYRRPGGIARLILRAHGSALLYHASLRGPAALVRHATALALAGLPLPAFNPRHAVRALLRGLPSTGRLRRFYSSNWGASADR